MFENDYNIVGKHATYVKYLASEIKINNNTLFERYIDVYMNAAIFGLLYNRTAQKDSSNDRARIYADAFATCRSDCIFLYRLVMLLEKSAEITPDERIDRAFRDDADEKKKDKLEANINLFHSYVLGGIEVLYEKYTDGCTTQEDYMERVYTLMSDFREEIQGISYGDKLKELIG